MSAFGNLFTSSRDIISRVFWDKQKVADPLPATTFAPPQSNDGAVMVAGQYGTYLELDGAIRNEAILIQRYRDIAAYSDCDSAVEDIVTDAIVATDDDKPVQIYLDNIEIPQQIKDKISDEFDNVCKLLDFNTRGHDIFRRWYVDGRLYYHKIIDEKHPKQGIKELRYLDPRKIKKVRTVEQIPDGNGNILIQTTGEYFVYNESVTPTQSTNPNLQSSQSSFSNNPLLAGRIGEIKISTESITLTTSGLLDLDKNMVLGYLHKAIRPVNHLRMMEDAMAIYRMTRTPDRRVFYVDTAGLNRTKAEAYVREVMNRYKNKIVYDATTGELINNRKHMTMMEDYWMPQGANGGTKIENLQGLQNAGAIDDVNFFQRKLYQALNVPLSRSQPEGFTFARGAEMSRDELKFAKFIDRLRKRFSELFNDILKTQLILKGIISIEDWEIIRADIQYRFINDTSMSEQRKLEDLRERIEIVQQMQMSNIIGTYYSKDWVKKQIFKMTDEEIEEQLEIIMQEKEQEMEELIQQQKMGLIPQ